GREADESERSGGELSRDHSAEHVDGAGERGRSEYYLCDVGSTNGTYIQLVGPYASSRRLELSDHILIGRTGFSINRFDWGVWEDRGARRTMEDKSVVIQDMGVESLASLGLGPQTFLAVYDGHGGAEASAFLWQRLHVAIAEALEDACPRISAALQQDRVAERLAVFGSGGGGEALRCDDRSETGSSSKSRGSGRVPGVFSSNSGGGSALMPPLPPPPGAASRPALAVTVTAATAPDGADGQEGREEGLWWGYDPTGAAAGGRVGGSGPRREAQPMPTAPSLPEEWLFGAREVANAVRSGGAAASTTTESQASAPDSSPRLPSCSDGSVDADGEVAPAAGGEAASGLYTETEGAGGEKGGGGGEAVEKEEEEEEELAGTGCSGVAWPPLLAGSGRQNDVQSPGGGPSRPLSSAGLPAEGGGRGFAHDGGAAGQERLKAPTAVDG
ncbi:unnamed protein product, partial [Hapterophycus canaliculatus]